MIWAFFPVRGIFGDKISEVKKKNFDERKKGVVRAGCCCLPTGTQRQVEGRASTAARNLTENMRFTWRSASSLHTETGEIFGMVHMLLQAFSFALDLRAVLKPTLFKLLKDDIMRMKPYSY